MSNTCELAVMSVLPINLLRELFGTQVYVYHFPFLGLHFFAATGSFTDNVVTHPARFILLTLKTGLNENFEQNYLQEIFDIKMYHLEM